MAESLGPLTEKRDLFATQNRAFIRLFEVQIEGGRASGEINADIDPRKPSPPKSSPSCAGFTLMYLIDPEHVDLAAMCDHAREVFKRKLEGHHSDVKKEISRR